MFFKPYYLGCLAHASYLLGGDNGEAAVIDPRRDVEEYLTDAAAAGLKITHVLETHLHADFVSGHVELARRTGATIHIGAKAGATFAHHPLQDGDEIRLGDVTLRFLETPGHTPEGITITALIEGEPSPRYVFTGDTLFVGDVGRPDLAGSKGFTPEQMAGLLYRSLQDKVLRLPDTTEVWPAHGAGSSCGRALSDARVSTIGKEKATNPALRYLEQEDKAGFIRYATEGLSTAPLYFAHDVAQNRGEPRSVEEIIASARPLPPVEVEKRMTETVLVLDTRSVEEFGKGHLPGAVHIQLEGKFAPWVGNIVAPTQPLILVVEPGHEKETMTRLARVGYERLLGWLEGGMEAWIAAGGETVTLPQIDAAMFPCALAAEETLLDVRAQSEWEADPIAGAIHIPLPELAARFSELPPGPLNVICGTGYRSSIACSLLQRAGRDDVSNVVGGWAACSARSPGKGQPSMSVHEILLPILGLITGFALGSLGSGGSVLALPAFVYAAGLPVKSAVATSLTVVGATSLVGAILAKRRCHTRGCPGQEVDIRVALLFALGGIVGSFCGARLAVLLSDRTQMLLFACVIAGAAIAMFRRKKEEAVASPPCEKACAEWVIPFLGLGIGLLTGLVGVGGGFLFVPALTLLAGIPMKRAASTSLWIIAANSATGVFGYVKDHTPIAWGAAALFLAMSIVGVLAGQHICRAAKSRGLQTAFAVFLVLVGTYTVTRTLVTKSKGTTGEKPTHRRAPASGTRSR